MSILDEIVKKMVEITTVLPKVSGSTRGYLSMATGDKILELEILFTTWSVGKYENDKQLSQGEILRIMTLKEQFFEQLPRNSKGKILGYLTVKAGEDFFLLHNYIAERLGEELVALSSPVQAAAAVESTVAINGLHFRGFWTKDYTKNQVDAQKLSNIIR